MVASGEDEEARRCRQKVTSVGGCDQASGNAAYPFVVLTEE